MLKIIFLNKNQSMHIKYFYIHLSISFKRSSNFNMDILKNKYTYNLDKNNSQENWNPCYVDKFNVSSSDADIKGNVCNLENFGIYRVFLNEFVLCIK